MNNKLYEYMRMGLYEEEKKYEEELFDTRKLGRISDEEIEAYNSSIRDDNYTDDEYYYLEDDYETETEDNAISDYEEFSHPYKETVYLDRSQMQEVPNQDNLENQDFNESVYEDYDNQQNYQNEEEYYTAEDVNPYQDNQISYEERPRTSIKDLVKTKPDSYQMPSFLQSESQVKRKSHNNNNILNAVSETNDNSYSKSSSTANDDKPFFHYRSRYSKGRNNASNNGKNLTPKTFELNGDTLLMGVLGKNEKKSLLPLIHQKIASLTDFNYSSSVFNIKEDNLENALKGALALNINGFNIGNPYMESVIPKLKAIGKSAYLVGYVDTLCFKEDGYIGFNTQIAAVKRTVLDDSIDLNERNVVILGSDLAVFAIILASIALKARNVVVIISSEEKTDKFMNTIKRLSSAYEETDIHVVCYDEDYMDKLNQLTTIKNFKWIAFNTDKELFDNDDFYERIEIGYDLAYDSLTTPFINKVLDCGGKTDNGLRMLIFKAVSSYELWSGKKASDDVANYIHNELKKQLYK